MNPNVCINLTIESNQMAIQDISTPKTAASAATQTAAPAAQQAGSFFLGRPPMERNPGGEFLNSLVAKFNEIVKTGANNIEYDLDIIPVDNTSSDTSLMFSSVIIAATHKNYRDCTAYHTLILEATADRVPPKFENFNAQQIEVLRPTSDAYDSTMVAVIRNRVAIAYPQAKLLNADACVVPRTFNLADQIAVHSLLANAFTACYNEILISHPDFRDVNVSNSGNNTTMTVQHRFERDQLEDSVGQPIRRDLIVGFSTQQNQNQQNVSLNAGQRVREVSSVGGFIDMVYMPKNAQRNAFMPVQQFQQPDALVTYAGRLVITDVTTKELSTPASLLLAIATAMTIRDNSAWYTTFYNAGGKRNDLHDIGAIGYEVPVGRAQGLPEGTRIDTKSASWGPGELGSLMSLAFHPGILFSLDVPDCGPQTWYTSVFAAAAAGNRDAYDAIYNAANSLTNGNFSQLFQKGQPIFINSGERFHMGYWTDENGVKRDIRELDYLAIMNLCGEKSKETIAEWSGTWDNTNIPVNERLAQRKRILMNVASNVEFTSYGTRLTFTPDVLQALGQSTATAGLRISVRDGFNTNEFMSQRGVAAFNNGLLSNGVTPFVQGFGGNVGNVGNNSYYSRWGR